MKYVYELCISIANTPISRSQKRNYYFFQQKDVHNEIPEIARVTSANEFHGGLDVVSLDGEHGLASEREDEASERQQVLLLVHRHHGDGGAGVKKHHVRDAAEAESQSRHVSVREDHFARVEAAAGEARVVDRPQRRSQLDHVTPDQRLRQQT